MPRFPELKPRRSGLEISDDEFYATFTTSAFGFRANFSDEAEQVATLAVVFDLGGFTKFCEQSSADVAVPGFLEKFLEWLISKIREKVSGEREPQRTLINRYNLPYFVKFTGDGAIFLWNLARLGEGRIPLLLQHMLEIVSEYNNHHFKRIKKFYPLTPALLRCGIARGTCFPLGNRDDMVGACINIAARLQKLPGLTFAVRSLGIEIDAPLIANSVVLYKTIKIRGGNEENIYLLKEEFHKMKTRDRKLYKAIYS